MFEDNTHEYRLII